MVKKSVEIGINLQTYKGSILINFFFSTLDFTTQAPKSSHASMYEYATWSVTALAVVLIIIVIALGIVICRMRPRDY